MKFKAYLTMGILLFLACGGLAFAAQEDALSSPKPTVTYAIKHDTSPPLALLKSPPPQPGRPKEIPMQEREWVKRAGPAALTEDPLLWQQDISRVLAPMPAPILTFEGTSDDQNAAIVGFRVVPPDTNGDVGPNHYVQWNNLIFAIWNKSGVMAAGYPKAGNAPFAGFGGPCETNNDGDPLVLYDQIANRWVLSQFSIGQGTQCVAVSQTPDPTGAYHRYAFIVTPGAQNDYPKMGVWPDGYYSTYRRFPGSQFAIVAAAFERDKMLLGQAAALVTFVIPAPAGPGCNGAGVCYEGVLPSHLEGTTLPPANTPNYFVMSDDDEAFSTTPDGTKDFIHVWKFAVNWANPPASTFTGPVNVDVAEMDINLCNFGSCVPQMSSGSLLDTLSFFTMYRAVYRNFGTHEALWINNTVDVGADRAGIRWFELRNPGGAPPTLFQAGTHAPADGLHRWMGSLSVDKQGNMALGYSVSSSGMFPSIRYAGRLAGDPLGTLPQTETEMTAGTGSQTGAGRWGDYSAMSIDETDDCTFWYTTEYYQVTGGFDFNSRIGAFKFPGCTAGPTGTLTGTVTAANNGNPIAGANVMAGAVSTTTNAQGVYNMTIAGGTYDVTASAFGYQAQTVNGVVVTDGQTTTQNFSLTPVPAIAVDGFVTDGSGAGWPLYAKVDIATAGGPTQTVYTDPNTGYYSANLLANTAYAFTVTSQIAGYTPATRNVTTASADLQENFALNVAAACTVPGYSLVTTPILGADFAGGIPAGWSVTNTTTNCSASGNPQWNTANPGARLNLTGGSGLFAIADSDRCGSSVQMNTDMTTPNLDLSSLGTGESLQITFNSDYRDLCGGTDEVRLEVYNGTTWSTVFNFCGLTNRRGPRVESFTTSAANGVNNARVRWHYKGGWDWWWEVDNVNLSLAECRFQGGGMVYGNVYDANTTLALNGAAVALDSGQATTTVPTPGNPNIDDGFYIMYAPLQGNAPGVRTITVSKARYGTLQRQFVPEPSGAHRENFNLPAGRLAANPLELRKRLPIAGTGNSTLTLTNSGGIVAGVNLVEINAPVPSAPQTGAIEAVTLPFNTNTTEGNRLSMALTAEDVRNTNKVKASKLPIIPMAGESVFEFATGLTYPWGLGFNLNASDLWVGNIAAGGGDDLNYRFTTAGTNTGDTIDTVAFVAAFAADMTYNPRTGMLWQVNVGGDNCLYEMNPVSKTATGNKICPAFGTSMRGLAYDPIKDTYYVGTWNGDFVVEVAPNGTILRQKTVGLNVSGLAFNASNGHLFVQVNDANQLVWVLDVNNNFGVLGSFSLKDQAGNPAYAAFEGAGIEIDCQGNLWSANQISKKVFANKSGETGSCVTDIPWLNETPKTTTVNAGASKDIAVDFTAVGQPPGCKEAQLVVVNDTPYGDITLPAGLTVQFNDVPAGAFADTYIHGIAGFGVSYGCGGGNFCPTSAITRRTMAVWLLRAKYGAGYAPPPAVGIFGDVPPESFAADYIEDLYNKGFTNGCSTNPLLYCPDSNVTRAQMAKFLIVTLMGPGYTPPACAGVFSDVACPSTFANYIEDLYARGITSGCGTNPLRYCPSGTTTRAQMSIFVSRTFSIPVCKQ